MAALLLINTLFALLLARAGIVYAFVWCLSYALLFSSANCSFLLPRRRQFVFCALLPTIYNFRWHSILHIGGHALGGNAAMAATGYISHLLVCAHDRTLQPLPAFSCMFSLPYWIDCKLFVTVVLYIAGTGLNTIRGKVRYVTIEV